MAGILSSGGILSDSSFLDEMKKRVFGVLSQGSDLPRELGSGRGVSPAFLAQALRARQPVPQEGSVYQTWGEYGQDFANNLANQFPQEGDTLAQKISKLTAFGPGATVWHGSPHRFNKFDASRIGTGEGAQAYGHGLYFAENPSVAKDYQKMLSGTIVKDFDGKTIETGFHNDTARAATFLAENGGDFRKAIRKINDSYPGTAEPVLKELEYLRNAGAHIEKGSLYKVDLPDEQIAKMLDWDKPLSQQPDVVKALQPMMGGMSNEMLSLSGASLHQRLLQKLSGTLTPGDEASVLVANKLRELGIPGIRYLDQGSRTTGKGTYNYVVFPGGEDMLKILGRE